MRVLVMGDARVTRSILHRMLESRGGTVRRAGDGEYAPEAGARGKAVVAIRAEPIVAAVRCVNDARACRQEVGV